MAVYNVVVTEKMYNYVRKYGVNILIALKDCVVIITRGKVSKDQVEYFESKGRKVATLDINTVRFEELDPKNNEVPCVEVGGDRILFTSKPIEIPPLERIKRRIKR